MTIELFRNDSYLKEHKTIISEIVSEGLVLNETIFYPEGGGQAGDETLAYAVTQQRHWGHLGS